jgi:hypothetical protein
MYHEVLSKLKEFLTSKDLDIQKASVKITIKILREDFNNLVIFFEKEGNIIEPLIQAIF